jgi:hypothetical protein
MLPRIPTIAASSRVLSRVRFNSSFTKRECEHECSFGPKIHFYFYFYFYFFAEYEMLLVEKRQNVCLITLNRPKALNALCDKLINELNEVVTSVEQDNEIGATVVTGSAKAFAGKFWHFFRAYSNHPPIYLSPLSLKSLKNIMVVLIILFFFCCCLQCFSAGADIKEMSSKTFVQCVNANMFSQWDNITK